MPVRAALTEFSGLFSKQKNECEGDIFGGSNGKKEGERGLDMIKIHCAHV